MILGVPVGILVAGIASGIAYGLLGVGLVLVYRSSRFINFAHSQVGAFGASVMAIAILDGEVPYWVALPLGMLTAAAVSSAVEVGVVRRLRSAPRLMSMVATLGVGQFLLFMALLLNAGSTSGDTFPMPTGMPTFTVSGLPIAANEVGILILGPLSVLALTLFFTRSRFGLAIRGAASNPDAAAMAGMSPQRLTNLSWAIAGALACLTAAMLIPSLGLLAGAALGPTLLLRALAAAVVGRMNDLTTTFVAGTAIGLLDRIVQYKLPGEAGLTDVILLGVILVALLLQGRPGRREEEKGAWLAVKPWPALPESLRSVWAIRHAGWLIAVPAFAAALLLPRALNDAHASVMAQLLALVIVGLSLSVLTGLGGQLSLGQFAVGGAGAVGALLVAADGGSVLLGLLVGVVVGALVGVAIGIPALRVSGLLLAVATLALALAVRGYVFKQDGPWGFGDSTVASTARLFGQEIGSGRVQAYLAVALVALALLMVANLHGSSLGRVLVALRDNEDAARAFSVAAPFRKLQAYAIAGGLAGLGGALFAFTQTVVTAGTFAADTSIIVTVMVVVGGAGLVAGPLLGALIAMPTLIDMSFAAKGVITFSWLVLILYFPNGVAGVLRPVRSWFISIAARLAGVDAKAAWDSADPALATSRTPGSALNVTSLERAGTTGEPLLVATGLKKRFGGLQAIGGVDLTVHRGEVLGLIGPNGAGKTTLFECLSGFVRADEGSIVFNGRDITRWSPERRAHAGLIRSFQDSALFGTMTVLETVLVSMERRHPSRLLSSIAGVSGVERQRTQQARDLLDRFGLDRYRHTEIGALSTGTRRIVELACMVALEPTLLLLDEPSSGVAQAEVEALGEVLLDVRRHLDATLVIIEHDIPLVSSLSDRLVALETGTVLSVGNPDDVLTDPAVVDSYLGGDPTAVHRTTQPSRRGA